MTTNKEEALEVEIKEGKILISLPLDILELVTRGSQYVQESILMNEDGYDEERLKVKNKKVWAAEILSALQEEDEQGTTLVHQMFDSAIQNAIENGAEGVTIKEDVIEPEDDLYMGED